MYSIDDADQVVRVSEMPKMDVGAPQPTVFANDSTVIIAYFTPNAKTRDQDGHAFVTFSHWLAYMFGPPNDEAFEGHPLATRGLEPYRAYQVENSSWLRQLERMNEVHPNHKPELFQNYTHYILTFKERTFECIARSFSASVLPGPFNSDSLLAEFQRLLHESSAEARKQALSRLKMSVSKTQNDRNPD